MGINLKVVDVIKYEGKKESNGQAPIVWKSECEDFNTLSQLIVHESQEALLFLGGEGYDLFTTGTYILHTKNIPFLNKIINIPTGGVSPFHCEVYFVNKAEQMALPWGVGDVNFIDVTNNNYVFPIGASGEMSLSVVDSKKLVKKLVGTGTVLEKEGLTKYFKVPIIMHLKSMIPNILKERNISIFEMETFLPELSKILQMKITEEMMDYGICLEKFWISTIVKPESDPFYQALNRHRAEQVTVVNQGELDLKKAEIDKNLSLITHSGTVQKEMMNVDVKKYEQQQLGYTYQQKEGFDVLKRFADNEGVGSDLRNAAMGLGVGFGMGGAFGEIVGGITSNTMMAGFSNPISTPAMGNGMGTVVPESSIPGMINLKEEVEKKNDMEDEFSVFDRKMKKIIMAKEAGLLSDEEFAMQKAKLLEEI